MISGLYGLGGTYIEMFTSFVNRAFNYLFELFNKNYGYKLNLNGIYMLKYLTQASNTFNNITLPSTFLNLFK